MRHRLVVLAVALVAPWASAQETLSLDDVLALSETGDRTLQGAHFAVAQAHDRIGIAKAWRLTAPPAHV